MTSRCDPELFDKLGVDFGSAYVDALVRLGLPEQDTRTLD